MELILASASPRRTQILKENGFNFRVIPSDAEEILPKGANLQPKDYCIELAKLKARSVYNKLNNPALTVLGADTIVVLEGKIIGKPKDEKEATRILKSLSGRAHEVITGMAVVCAKGEFTAHCESKVIFPPFSDGFIDHYVKNYMPLDKAGAYGVQELINLADIKIFGSYDNVVGLPADKVKELLKQTEEI